MGQRVSVEHARGPRRDRSRDRRDSRRRGGGGGGDSRAPWLDKYGPPTRTDYRVTVENLSTRVSWQVSNLRPTKTGGHFYKYFVLNIDHCFYLQSPLSLAEMT